LYSSVLRDARFFQLLLKIDQATMQRVRDKGCPQDNGPLHAAHFRRKPRGTLVKAGELPEEYDVRFDLCCGWCRKRTMPESVRFIGPMVFVGVAVAITTVVARGPDVGAMRVLRRELKVSKGTVQRWCQWWLDLTGTAFWLRVRGVLPVVLDRESLPKSLLDSYEGEPAERLLRLMEFLSPLTGGVASRSRSLSAGSRQS
jgi:hypothetical protein